MSLFDNLPAPRNEPRKLAVEDEGPVVAADQGPEGQPAGEGHADQGDHVSPPPAKRARLDEPEVEEAGPGPSSAAPLEEAVAVDSVVGPNDQLGQALTRIASHISRPSKFAKASALLRQVLDTGTVDKEHRHQLFLAVKAAFAEPGNATDPQLRKEYRRLMAAVNAHAHILSKAERAHLSVYSTWALTQNELFTDDSFMFSKVVSQLKASITGLPPADEEQEAAARRLKGEDPLEPPPAATAAAAAATTKLADESDPFGLDEILREQQPAPEQQQAAAGGRPKAAAQAWDQAEQQVMAKQALLDCLQTARIQHKLTWAQTSVEHLIDHACQHRDRFLSHQQEAVAELMNFVKTARVARRTGRGAGAKGSEMTAFERARAEWGNATVPVRGKVGAAGDSKSNNWLG